jgi:hypothetical protein
MGIDRDEALRDDAYFSTGYNYDDEEDEWDDDDTKWEGDEEEVVVEEPADAKEDSNAYLEFLHEQVSRG